MYSPSELYEGNRNGQPLDPGLYELSMRFHFGDGFRPKTPQRLQQPLEITNRSRLSTGKKAERTRRGVTQSVNKRQLSFGLNAPGRSGGGGISF